MWPMIIAAIAQHVQARDKQRDMAKQGQRQIAQQRASETDYPTYGMQAANTRSQMNDVQVDAYPIAAPFEQLWLGLARYWRKRTG